MTATLYVFVRSSFPLPSTCLELPNVLVSGQLRESLAYGFLSLLNAAIGWVSWVTLGGLLQFCLDLVKIESQTGQGTERSINPL